MTPDDFRRIALSMPEATEVYRWGIPSSGWNEELSPAWE
jgi:hypothetical protein